MDYPASTLVPVKGKLYVSVTVPKQIEHLFKQKQIRLSTGTSDRKEAQKRQHKLASKIYERFDKAQQDQSNQAVERIHAFLQRFCDAIEHQIDIRSTMSKIDDESRALVRYLDNYTSQIIWDNPDVGTLSKQYEYIEALVEAYYRENTQAYIDLFRSADGRVGASGDFAPPNDLEQSTPDTKLRNVMYAYVEGRNWQRLKSRDAAQRQIEKFAACVGDLEVREVQKQHAYAFASALQSEGKAQKTIASHVSAVSAMLTWCEQNALIDESPFTNLKLASYGSKKKSWLPLSDDELHALFAQNIDDQDRLLLSILITTGMRLDEAALLTWEQLKTIDGVRCFDLTDAILKNTGSERVVALPDCLALPPHGSGRIFDYALDADGKASRRASRVLGPLIRNVSKNPRVVTHSLRGTLKDLLRNAGVSKEINDFITGHSGGDVASNYGQGPSLRKRYEAINSVNHPWLIQKLFNASDPEN